MIDYKGEFEQQTNSLRQLAVKLERSAVNHRNEGRATGYDNPHSMRVSYELGAIYADTAADVRKLLHFSELAIQHQRGYEEHANLNAADPSRDFGKSWLNGVVLATADDEKSQRMFGELAVNAAGELPEAEFNSDGEPVRWLVHYFQDWDTAAGVHKYRQRTTLVLEASLRPADRSLQRDHWVLVDRYDRQVGSVK